MTRSVPRVCLTEVRFEVMHPACNYFLLWPIEILAAWYGKRTITNSLKDFEWCIRQ